MSYWTNKSVIKVQNRNIQKTICIAPTPTNFPNGRAQQYIPANGKYYKFSRIDEMGNICYELASVIIGARRRKNKTAPIRNRVCTGEITFNASNSCNIGSPEDFDVAFVLNPLGELFNINDPCGAGDHNYSAFLCSDSVSTIRTKLLASLQYQFVGKVDFSVSRSGSSGTGFDNFAFPIAIQSDGKIIVGGGFSSYNGTGSIRLIRLNQDGSVDTVALGSGFDDTVRSIAIQNDGKIIVGGDFTSYNGTASSQIIRLNSDFTIDTVALGTGFSAFRQVDIVALQADGKILVGGTFTSYNGTASKGIIRLNSDFTIDTVAVGTGISAEVVSLVIQPDGKIILVGQFANYNGTTSRNIIRLNADLTIDTVAVGTGFSLLSFVDAIVLQPNGKIILGGSFTSYNGTTSNRIIRLNSDLTIDTVSVGSGFDNTVLSIILDSSGTIIVGGTFSSYNGTTSNQIIILNSDFTINTIAVGNGFNGGRVNAIQSDNKIVVVGIFTQYDSIASNNIVQLNSDLTINMASNPIYTIIVTYTDVSTSTTPTSLFGTVLENCVNIENNIDMNLSCFIQ